VSARAVELSARDAEGYLGRVSPGAYLEVAVQDRGAGIKPEVQRRLFVEPFHTTKVRHRGLGLAIVYRILYAHRAGVRIDPSPEPPGTLVRVVLPLAAARPPAVGITASPTLGGKL
jgi:signal transduction histidine kinase